MSGSDLALPAPLAAAVARARSAAVASPGAAALALTLMDLTNLDEAAEVGAIDRLCAQAMDGPVAAVCVYPQWIARARERLAGSGVPAATVANFPQARGTPAAVAEEIAQARDAGADEIDLVIPYAAVLAGDLATAGEVLAAGRHASGTAPLKVIIETGAMDRAAPITQACRLAIDNGADFLKTSTGKGPPGASLAAAALLLEAAAGAGRPVGVKVSGGIRTVAEAAGYLALANDGTFAGAADPAEFRRSPAGLRIGASSLLDEVRALLATASPG